MLIIIFDNLRNLDRESATLTVAQNAPLNEFINMSMAFYQLAERRPQAKARYPREVLFIRYSYGTTENVRVLV